MNTNNSKINPKLLSEKIERVFNEPKLLKELSEKSLKKSKEFDGEKIEKREAEIYQELIKGK